MLTDTRKGVLVSEDEAKIMNLFIDNAKTYVQLSIGALVLSVTFLRDVLGAPEGKRLPVPDAFRKLGLLGRFAAFTCSRYRCSSPAVCTGFQAQPPPGRGK